MPSRINRRLTVVANADATQQFFHRRTEAFSFVGAFSVPFPANGYGLNLLILRRRKVHYEEFDSRFDEAIVDGAIRTDPFFDCCL